jgi:hypothetical protein
MREDAYNFAALNEADAKRPRFIAAVIYDVDSLYVTSHAGIADVPGTVIDGALNEPVVTTQKLNPDEGAAEIGAASFGIVDLGAQFTTEVRERLRDGSGLRGRQVRFYLGYEGLAFSEFVLIGTQIVQAASYSQGRYTVQCLDIQRSLRTDIFNLVQTTLATSASATDTTLTLSSSAGLQRISHGSSYSDAPNTIVGYVKIKSEIIRYTGIAGNQLTGCTRGVFGTVAAPYTVDPSTPADRRERVVEYVYLEMPAIKLAYAVLTGKLWGSVNTLPPGWHMGVDPDLITDEDFTGIGSDLWNADDDSKGFIVRFEGLAKTDGKRFLEKEIYLLTGTYSPVYADGTLGLRRNVRLSDDAATVATLDESNSIQVGDLQHDMESLHNLFEVNWSWNGDEYRRATAYADLASKQTHGEAPVMSLSFKGLHGSRHTDGVIFQLLDMLRDAYAGPPLRLTVQPLHALNRIEVGDVVRVRYQHIRDFSQLGESTSVALNRACIVHNVSTDHRSGRLSLELFGSTANPSIKAPTGATTSLPNAYYPSEGSALASAPGITIVGGVLTAATSILTGGSVLTAAPSIFYYDGDLTIGAGVTLRIANNVQLRVRGFLTVNGFIDGRGRGLAGVIDDGRMLPVKVSGESVAAEWIPGNSGYVGGSRGFDGVHSTVGFVTMHAFSSYAVGVTTSRHPVAPRLLLNVAGNVLSGLPSDLRGTGGGPGGRVGGSSTLPTAGELGGPGANGGAGLAIICRGLGLGANGLIDLSGADSTPTVAHTSSSVDRFPGAGGGGGPGALYVLLDGGNLSVPDFGGGKFRAIAGTVPVQGNPMPKRTYNRYDTNPAATPGSDPGVVEPIAGWVDPDFVTVNGQNLSGSALVVQHVPASEATYDDAAPEVPPAPYGISTESIEQGINVYLSLPPVELWDVVELYASIDNNRANAVKIAEGKFDSFRYRVPDGATRAFWARTKKNGIRSAFTPTSATGGILGTALGGLRVTGTMEVFGTTARKSSGVSAWDSSFYSSETYSGGVFVSFQPVGTAGLYMVGLNSDPESSSSYESLDYAWYVHSDGALRMYESGVLASTIAAPAYNANTVLEIRYDGQRVTYYRDGIAQRSVQRFDASFFVDSSFLNVGSSIRNIKFGPLTPAPSIPWVARGNCIATATGIKKEGGGNAWDSDCHSFEAYRRGAFVSFQGNAANVTLMVGLNADPTTDQSYTSIDFAWHLQSDGNCSIYESGLYGVAYGAYSSDTVFAIAYDGATVRYIKDGVLVRQVYAPDRTFYMDSSFYSPGSAVRNLTFTPYGSATPVPFLARGNVTVSDTTAQKVGGVSAWDSDFVSINGYPIAFVEFKCSAANAALMVGLNSDPYTDSSYTSIDAAWYPQESGALSIYESGGHIGAFGSYTPSTILAITYDGVTTRYYKDGVLVRAVNLGAGLTMFADASFATPGAAINSLRFGPGTNLTQIDTPQLRPAAATEQVQKIVADSYFLFPTISAGAGFTDTRIIDSVTVTNSSQETIPVDVSYKGLFYLGGTESSGIGRFAYLEIPGYYSESSAAGYFSNRVAPDALPRSGSVTVTLAPGASLTAQLRIALRLAVGGVYSSIPNAHWRDVVITGTMLKR